MRELKCITLFKWSFKMKDKPDTEYAVLGAPAAFPQDRGPDSQRM